MGLNENVTYNIMKEKGLYRDTLEFTEERVQLFPMRPPKRKHKQKMIKNTGYPEAMGLEYDHIWNSNWGLIGIVGGEEGEPRGNIPG